jgi:hypothetical protein
MSLGGIKSNAIDLPLGQPETNVMLDEDPREG